MNLSGGNILNYFQLRSFWEINELLPCGHWSVTDPPNSTSNWANFDGLWEDIGNLDCVKEDDDAIAKFCSSGSDVTSSASSVNIKSVSS